MTNAVTNIKQASSIKLKRKRCFTLSHASPNAAVKNAVKQPALNKASSSMSRRHPGRRIQAIAAMAGDMKRRMRIGLPI